MRAFQNNTMKHSAGKFPWMSWKSGFILIHSETRKFKLKSKLVPMCEHWLYMWCIRVVGNVHPAKQLKAWFINFIRNEGNYLMLIFTFDRIIHCCYCIWHSFCVWEQWLKLNVAIFSLNSVTLVWTALYI